MKIPGYKLGSPIAENAYSTFYNALSAQDGRLATVQLFNAELTNNKSFCTQFDNISRFLAGKFFGCMTPLKQSGRNPSGSYAIYYYFSGYEHHSDALPKYPVNQVLLSGYKLANALSQLHQVGLVHAGVEPGAIIMQGRGQVVLGPPALHRVLPALRAAALSTMTPQQRLYLAPEARQELTAATDFYALGVVMYQFMHGHTPFRTDDSAAQEEQPLPVNDQCKHLSPFFQQILARDERQRIRTVMQFRQALQNCGVDLEEITEQAEAHSPDPGLVAAIDHAGSPRRASRKGGLYLMMALFFSISLAYFLSELKPPLISDDDPLPPEKVAQPLPSEISVPLTPAVAVDLGEEHYQLALQHVAGKRFGAALIAVNDALKENVSHHSALQLKKQIVIELELQPLFNKATRQIDEQRLSRPPGDNALETYRQIASLLDSDDERLRLGYASIADSYHRLAGDEIAAQQFNIASTYISSGLSVVPQHQGLLELQAELDRQLQLIAQQREQQRQAAQTKRLAEQRAREQQLALQQQRQSREQQQQAELRRRQLLAQQQYQQQLAEQNEQKRQQRQQLDRKKVDRLVMSARSYLAAYQLNLHTINVARDDYLEAVDLAQDGDDRISSLRQDIISAYGNLATTLKDSYQYDLALNALDRALVVDQGDPFLLRLRNEINSLMRIRDQGLDSAN